MGNNMIRRKKYSTIKELVFDTIHQTEGKIDYETLTKYVLKHDPHSKWGPTHWTYYKYEIRKGKFKNDFSDEEKKNLKLKKPNKRSPKVFPVGKKKKQEEDQIKLIGDNILNHVRMKVKEFAKDDEDFEFKLNRWVYARLQQDEIAKKRPIKQELWDLGMRSCHDCNKEFQTLKGVEIHRKDTSKAYSKNNCELLCRPCHQKR